MLQGKFMQAVLAATTLVAGVSMSAAPARADLFSELAALLEGNPNSCSKVVGADGSSTISCTAAQAIPEPTTMAGIALAAGAGAVLKRRASKK